MLTGSVVSTMTPLTTSDDCASDTPDATRVKTTLTAIMSEASKDEGRSTVPPGNVAEREASGSVPDGAPTWSRPCSSPRPSSVQRISVRDGYPLRPLTKTSGFMIQMTDTPATIETPDHCVQ